MDNAYIELHCHSYYSLLDGASAPQALVQRAAELGMSALALTDHAGLYGAVDFWCAAQETGVHPIVGAEIGLNDDEKPGPDRATHHHLTLLAESQAGYSNLCRLVSQGQLAGQKNAPTFTWENLAAHAEDLICLSGCRRGLIPQAIQAKDYRRAVRAAELLRDTFGADHFYIELQRHALIDDHRRTTLLARLADHIGVGTVATNNVHYATPVGQPLHEVLTCIRQRTTLELGRSLLWPNCERYLKSPEQMAALFADFPEAILNTQRIARRCQTSPVSLDLSAHRLPDFPVPAGETAFSYLYQLCQRGARWRYRPVTPAMSRQLAHELDVIEQTGLATFFLVVWDICRFCRENDIPCQGRGSAANSLVAYVLGITAVDPLVHDLLFERFLSREANTTPDIDLDISTAHRDEVIEYVYDTYGEEHTAMVCNVVAFRMRSAIRDIGMALAFPLDVVDQMAKAVDHHFDAPLEAQLASIEDFRERLQSRRWDVFLGLVRALQGVPRHLSIHNGGMLITASPLVDIVPLERATMPGRVVTQWNKDSIEDTGLIKIDLLGLRTLSLIHEAVDLIRRHEGVDVDIQALPLDDPKVYDLLCAADTIGAFQVESRAQAQLLPRLKPRRFEDIVVATAIIRPGPIQGDMVHPYLRRRDGVEAVEYLHPALEPALKETLGVMLYQEQVLKVAMAVAGFSPGEADALRRAMSRARSRSAMEALRPAFVGGAEAQGVDAGVAHTIFDQITGYAGYGFCKSHAASFALIACATCWLKVYYPAAFYCALLNQQPMGFYPVEVVVNDARHHGVPLLRPDIQRSMAECALERGAEVNGQVSESGMRSQTSQPAIRLGFRFVRGMGDVGGERIVAAREAGAFQGLYDFCRRTRLPHRAIERLIMVGAMDRWAIPRRKLVWELGKIGLPEEALGLELPPDVVELPALTRSELIDLEYDNLGTNVGEHVMALYREQLAAQGVLSSRELDAAPDGRQVCVAGLQVMRQRPSTAKGMMFISLEDEWGLMNVVVRPGIYERYRQVVRGSKLLMVTGVVERQGAVVNVVARLMTGLAA